MSEKLYCKACGREITEERLGNSVMASDGSVFCDGGCAASVGYLRCDKCGTLEPATNIKPVGYLRLCNSCVEDGLVNGVIVPCDVCGKLNFASALRSVRTADGMVSMCNLCRASGELVECYVCHIWYKQSPGHEIVCPDCSGRARRCMNCNEVMGEEKLRDGLCVDCFNERDYEQAREGGYIQQYHTSHEVGYRPERLGIGGERVLYGFELEVQKFDGLKAKRLIDIILEVESVFGDVFIERDSSLGNTGFEIISQPFSLQAYPFVMDRVARGCKLLSDSGYMANTDDEFVSSGCGLHFHVSRTAIDTNGLARLLMIVDKALPTIIAASRRDSDSLQEFARPINMPCIKGLPASCAQGTIINNVINKRVANHHKMVNLDNRNTIEFRFFKGTLVPEYFDASFEMVNALLDMARTTSVYSIAKMTPNSFIDRVGKRSKSLASYLRKAVAKRLIAA